jgi:hypothetical protein
LLLPYLPGEGLLAYAQEIQEKSTSRVASKTRAKDPDTLSLVYPESSIHNYEMFFEWYDAEGVSDWEFLTGVCRGRPNYDEPDLLC